MKNNNRFKSNFLITLILILIFQIYMGLAILALSFTSGYIVGREIGEFAASHTHQSESTVKEWASNGGLITLILFSFIMLIFIVFCGIDERLKSNLPFYIIIIISNLYNIFLKN